MAAPREEQIKIIPLSERVKASVIIPFFYAEREKNLEGLIEDLKSQTFKDIEVIISSGISPQGRAINQGAKVARGNIFIVLDDDSRIGHSKVIENFVRIIEEDPSCAMVGASILTPEHANRFQKMTAKQFPRFNMPIVKELTDSDLPCHGCAAFRKDVFVSVGMERENIIRGLDPDFRVRIRKAGYRVVLAPDTWAYHPLPPTLSKFIRMFIRNGYGSAYAQVHHPEINYDTDENIEEKGFVPKRPFIYRIFRFPVRLLKSLVTFQWIRFLGYTVYLIGYIQGYVQFSFMKSNR
ncbi:MAG: glycosyltransferase [Candidatus Omnitrophota bacterium]|jgi:GT2 family glycosyltransferase